MKQNEFKAGDQVYYPSKGRGVYVLSALKDVVCPPVYPVSYNGQSFTGFGLLFHNSKIPSIFHATPENKALLDALYGVEFDAPPVKLSGSDLTRKMFNEFDAPILCYVNNLKEDVGLVDTLLRLIVQAEGDCFVDHVGQEWNYATPYCGQVQTVKGGE